MSLQAGRKTYYLPYLADRKAKSFVSNHHICTKLLSDPRFKWHHPQVLETVTQSCLVCVQVSNHYSQRKVTQGWGSPFGVCSTKPADAVLVDTLLCVPLACPAPQHCPMWHTETPSPVHRLWQSRERQWDLAAGPFYRYHRLFCNLLAAVMALPFLKIAHHYLSCHRLK